MIGENDSNASRLWSLEDFSLFCYLLACLFYGRKMGNLRGRSGGRHGSGGMRGRAWISMTIDGRIGLGGWKEDIVVFSYILLSSPSVMLVG